MKSLFKDDPLLKPLAGGSGIRMAAGDVTPKSNLGSNIGNALGGFTLGQQDKTGSIFGQGLISSSLFAPVPGPRDEKELFFQKKKREEIERLESEITAERLKLTKAEAEHQKRIDDLRDKHTQDLQSIEAS